MYDKTVDTHPSTIQSVPECYKTHSTYYEGVHRCLFIFVSFPDQYESQKLCDLAVSFYPFVIVYSLEKYKTQRMCDEAVDDSLAAVIA